MQFLEAVILKNPEQNFAIDPKTGKALIAEDALMPYEFLTKLSGVLKIKKNIILIC